MSTLEIDPSAHAPSCESKHSLRAGIRIDLEADDHVLVDEWTGLRLVLGKDAADLLKALPVMTSGATSVDEVHAFLQFIEMLGLFEPTTLSEATYAQGHYVLQQALDSEEARVRSTIERAARTTGLHRTYLGRHLTDRPDWKITDLPILRKAGIRDHFPRGLVPDDVDTAVLLRTKDLVLARTSGTTGERLQVFSDTRVPRLPPDPCRFWRLVPRDRPLRTVVFASPICSPTTCSSELDPKDRVSFEHTLFLPSPVDPFRMTDEDARTAIDEMRAFEADLWLVNPIYLVALAKKADECGYALPPPRAILYSYQFFSHCQRRAIARHLDAPVFALYSATELGGSQIGVSCPEGQMHVRLDHVHLELLREGLPVAPSELGMVTVTTHNATLPLVRYAVGDLARMRIAPCACTVGSSWPSFVLEGRERDAFVLDGGWITTKAVDDALRDVDLALYQLSELAPHRYRLHAIPEKGARRWREGAEAALTKLLTPKDLIVEEVSELAMDVSQKFRFTVPLARPEPAT